MKAAETSTAGSHLRSQLSRLDGLLRRSPGPAYQIPQVEAVSYSYGAAGPDPDRIVELPFAGEVMRLPHISRYLNIANVI